MRFNIFEGARRIALIIGSLVVAVTLFALFENPPVVSNQYWFVQPNGAFIRTQESCLLDSDRHQFASKTSKGESVPVTLCLPSRGSDNPLEYEVSRITDPLSAYYSDRAYEKEKRTLQDRFKLSASDEEALKKETSQRYLKHWLSGLGYLALGEIEWVKRLPAGL
jgi:hypothetical protein